MSESNKFTPGPWLYRGKSNSVHESCSTHPFGHTIFVFDDDSPLRDPDISLILAAPDLLEALKNLENDDGQIPDHAWTLCQDAIRAAEGEMK